MKYRELNNSIIFYKMKSAYFFKTILLTHLYNAVDFSQSNNQTRDELT